MEHGHADLLISVLGQEYGFGALGMSAYYGRHCKKTGFELMLVIFVYEAFLRLPFFFFGLVFGVMKMIKYTSYMTKLMKYCRIT